jgi:hypothetical protein
MSTTSPSTSSWRSKSPSTVQLSTLRRLAQSRGQSFAMPRTRGDASDQIDRLKAVRPTSRVERTRERDTAKVLSIPAALTNAASVGDDEVTGYGSTARGAASVGDTATAAIAAPWDLAARRRYYAEQNRESQLRGRAQ